MHFDEPLISVIMPAYNCERYIGDAIESVINQTYSNWELLIGDDCSSDQTLRIVAGYAMGDHRIKYCQNIQNEGAAFTRNRLVAQAAGEYVAMMDCDDISHKERLVAQLEFLRTKRVDACGTNYFTIDARGQTVKQHQNFSSYQQVLWSAFTNFSFCNASLMLKRDAFLSIGGYKEGLRTEAEDVDMMFRFLAAGFTVENLGEGYYYGYRQHPESVSKRSSRIQRANSFTATKVLVESTIGHAPPDDFVHFLKYYHLPDFQLTGDCAELFKGLLELRDAIESKILKSKVRDTKVRMDIARKMFFLFLNERYGRGVLSLSMAVRAVRYHPPVLVAVIKSKWKHSL